MPIVKVALVSSSFDPHVGGVEEHVRQVARELVRAGDDVEVWTVDRGEHFGERVIEGIRVRYLPTPLPARTVSAMLRFALQAPGAWRRWRRAHDQFRPELVHVHCYGPNGVYALRLHQVTGVPLAITSHGETLGDDSSIYTRSDLLRNSLTTAIEKAALVTAPSMYVLDDLRSTYGLHSGIVVTNGVDLEVTPLEVVDTPKPYIFAVGRLGYMKGFDLLIDAFAHSRLATTHFLVIGGDGSERHRLVERARAVGVVDRLRLLGRLTAEEVASAMSGALCVVVPSRSEAFGIAALEAWRSETTLIMTSRGGGSEFVRDGSDGLLIDPENTVALAAAMRRVAGEGAFRDRLARAGRARVPHFSWQRVTAAYRELYATVVPVRQVPDGGRKP